MSDLVCPSKGKMEQGKKSRMRAACGSLVCGQKEEESRAQEGLPWGCDGVPAGGAAEVRQQPWERGLWLSR